MEEKVYLELITKRNYKFYELIIKDLVVFVSYGRIGKKGNLKTFTFNDTTEAIKLFSSKIKSKVKKI
jgi:predicted DNA-binding WGR domain protein